LLYKCVDLEFAMRISSLLLLAAVAFAPAPALAYENYIPLGHSYSPDDSVLPEFNSDQDKLNSEVDIYESEIYNRQRRAKVFSSELDRFKNDQEISGSSDFIDY
jgi:hypothetical protein